jgi:hypothetical protein
MFKAGQRIIRSFGTSESFDDWLSWVYLVAGPSLRQYPISAQCFLLSEQPCHEVLERRAFMHSQCLFSVPYTGHGLPQVLSCFCKAGTANSGREGLGSGLDTTRLSVAECVRRIRSASAGNYAACVNILRAARDVFRQKAFDFTREHRSIHWRLIIKSVECKW